MLADTTNTMPVVHRNGQAYVTSSSLADKMKIAVKPFDMSKGQVIACIEDRCAIVDAAMSQDKKVLVDLQSLAKALNYRVHLDGDKQSVWLEAGKKFPKIADSKSNKVGQLAPDFRLQALDGTLVALSDFRGKRVLINSWASW